MESYRNFIEARNILPNAKEYNKVKEKFSWSNIEKFNWTLDYFDKIVEEVSNPVILYIDDDGAEKGV